MAADPLEGLIQAARNRQAAELAERAKLDDSTRAFAAAYLAAAAEWSARLDAFCAALKAHGLAVERDGFTVTIGLPDEKGSA